MTAVIYKSSPKYIHVVAHYDSVSQAERVLNFAKTKGYRVGGRKWDFEDLELMKVAEYNDFHNNIDKDVVVKNLMNGELVHIRASQVGTCTDPSTETYWSM